MSPADSISDIESANIGKNYIILKWNNFDSFILKSLSELYTRNELTDVTLVCNDASFASHKVILAMWSPYFRDIFLNNPCKHPVIILQDVSGENMELLLSFVYQGGVFIERKAAKGFLAMADSLKISGIGETRKHTAANISDSDYNKDNTTNSTGCNNKTNENSTPCNSATTVVLPSIDSYGNSAQTNDLEIVFESNFCVETPDDSPIDSEIVGTGNDNSPLTLGVDVNGNASLECRKTCIMSQHIQESSRTAIIDSESEFDIRSRSPSIIYLSSEDEADVEDETDPSSMAMEFNAPETCKNIPPSTRITKMDIGNLNADEDEDSFADSLAHSGVELEALESTEPGPSNRPVKMESPLESVVVSCPICSMNVRQNNLRLHMKRSHVDNNMLNLRCPLCGNMMKSKLMYFLHMNGHRRKGHFVGHLNPVVQLHT